MQLGSSGSPGSMEAAVRSEINVTPLVDVCLVLLIIFMVVTPLLTKGVAVALPETGNPSKMPESAKQLDIAVQQDGKVFIGQNWVRKEDLNRTLSDIYLHNPEKDVVIKADRRLPYRQVREVMKLVNQAGFSGVGLETRKEPQAGG
jgi:biopolymer transport protein TolR